MEVKVINDLIKKEEQRQKDFVTLIASENYAPKDVLNAAGSVLTNKYAEGYPGARYYGGCEVIDQIEEIAINSLKELFGVKYANVQPHSGASANNAVYKALLKPGDKIMGLELSAGGHLSHGAKFNISGQAYESVTYSVDKETEMLDYDEIEKIAIKEKPNLIICGYSAYPREIDFKRFKEIADKVGAYLMADIAHIAGLIASGNHSTPVGFADVITSTTHKTLRGPRGGIIMTNDLEISKKINRGVFPGTQGGPLENIIAAKAICFVLDSKKEFKEYGDKIIENTKAMVNVFKNSNFRVTTGGSDNHLFLVDVFSRLKIDGKVVQEKLKEINVIVNMNSIPFDKLPTSAPSGIRIGTAAITTIGATTKDCEYIARSIIDVLSDMDNSKLISEIKNKIIKLSNDL